MNINESAPVPESPTNLPMELDDAHPPLAQAITAMPVAIAAPVEKRAGSGFWAWAMPVMFLIPIIVLLAYAIPYLLYHWRIVEAQAEAESYYMKRRAELKAEAEQADSRIDLIDKRVHLTSLRLS